MHRRTAEPYTVLPVRRGRLIGKFATFFAVVVLGAACSAPTPQRGPTTSPPAVEGSEQEGTDTVMVSGAPLPEFTPDAVDAAIGMPAPALRGSDYQGEVTSFDPVGSAPQLLVFVAHWCPHCQAELPVLASWVSDGARLPVTIVSTAHAPDRGNWPPDAWLDREGWTGEVIVDDDSLSALQSSGMNSFPAFVAVDSSGNVVARHTGALGRDGLDSLAALLDS